MSDPLVISQYIADKSDVFSGLAGVFIGSMITYFSTKQLERAKTEELIKKLHCVLIMEISAHASQLNRVIDHVLPAWLHRGTPEVWNSEDIIDVLSAYHLNTFCFDSFVEQLTYSPSLVPITTYYQSVRGLNERIKFQNENVSKNEIDAEGLIRHCCLLLQASIDATDDLLKTRGIKKCYTPLLKNSIDDFISSKSNYEYLLAIAKKDYPGLLDWGIKLEYGETPNDLPHPFSDDKGALLLSYFMGARSFRKHGSVM